MKTWIWYQKEGELWRDDEDRRVAAGYAGAPAGKNDPDAEGIKSTGPVPRGKYSIVDPVATHGGFALPLVPDEETRARILELGRRPDSFMIHGDALDPAMRGRISKGCIILPRIVRMAIWQSPCHELEVRRELGAGEEAAG